MVLLLTLICLILSVTEVISLTEDKANSVFSSFLLPQTEFYLSLEGYHRYNLVNLVILIIIYLVCFVSWSIKCYLLTRNDYESFIEEEMQTTFDQKYPTSIQNKKIN